MYMSGLGVSLSLSHVSIHPQVVSLVLSPVVDFRP